MSKTLTTRQIIKLSQQAVFQSIERNYARYDNKEFVSAKELAAYILEEIKQGVK